MRQWLWQQPLRRVNDCLAGRSQLIEQSAVLAMKRTIRKHEKKRVLFWKLNLPEVNKKAIRLVNSGQQKLAEGQVCFLSYLPYVRMKSDLASFSLRPAPNIYLLFFKPEYCNALSLVIYKTEF
ncbi:hypothetical protein J6590_040071 [Homalodisca vitripennis]|nr:hypothetical protein J6590_040071 [Homalodisca vitripennis]